MKETKRNFLIHFSNSVDSFSTYFLRMERNNDHEASTYYEYAINTEAGKNLYVIAIII